MSDWADEIAKAMKGSWRRWPLREPSEYWPKEADIAAALRKAKSDALETAAANLSDRWQFNPKLIVLQLKEKQP